jgi:hypothetical protein
MEDLDQRVREGFSLQMGPEKVAEMQAVDAKHTTRMKEIIVRYAGQAVLWSATTALTLPGSWCSTRRRRSWRSACR